MEKMDLAEALSRLESVAQELNAESDTINPILRRVEEGLASLKVGLEVWLDEPLLGEQNKTIGRGSWETGTWTELRLGYARCKEGWSLAVKRIRVETGFFEGDPDAPYRNEYEDSKPLPLLTLSREVRVAALGCLHDLLLAIRSAKDLVKRTPVLPKRKPVLPERVADQRNQRRKLA